MDTFKSFESKIYEVNDGTFTDIALELFRFQATRNPIYKAFVENLKVRVTDVDRLDQIPFLPITFFKHHLIQSDRWEPEVTFTSSGTTNTRASVHAVPSLEFYLRHSRRCFEFFFGSISNYHFLALLPSYLERKGSSLITMMDYFIRESHSDFSAFYLNDIQKLLNDIEQLRQNDRKTILWGVSFALMDLAEKHQTDLSPFMVFETGGMKGRRTEITRAALHEILAGSLNASAIFSEYGMTELMSQAYTKGENRFFAPPWMKVLARELTDPMQKGLLNETGGINVVDLGNYHSVAFIETEDLGKVYTDGSFEVLGRLDNSDVRGCNLLID